jgi:hypothetical protein
MQKKTNFRITMVNKCLSTFLCSIFLVSISFAGEKVNFSGEWGINQEKSNLGENNFNVVGTKLIIEQKGNEFTLTRFINGMDGQATQSIEKHTMDGKESTNTVFNNSPKKSTLTWSEDGKSFTIISTIIFDNNGEKMEIKSNEIWKMADDGTFTIELNSTSSWGDMKQLYLFSKLPPKP